MLCTVFPLTVDVKVERVLNLAGWHDGVLGSAAQQFSVVGDLGLEAQGARGQVALVRGLHGKKVLFRGA